MQNHFAPADYYRLPEQMLIYQKQSYFLPFLNNEVGHDDYDMY